MHWKSVAFSIALLLTCATCSFGEPAPAPSPSTIHIQQTQTTAQPGFPAYLGMYQVLDGASSSAELLSLDGTLSLKNFDPKFSEVLFLIVYWRGSCPANDVNLTQASGIIWSDILKNPSQSKDTFLVHQDFSEPVPMSGCIGLYYSGGPLEAGKVTMSADLTLAYKPLRTFGADAILDLSGEYCFGQEGGCENFTAVQGEGFAVPFAMDTAGHLAELDGNISDSTFDGSNPVSPLPTGTSWGASNDFYLLPGGCGKFGENLNSQGFPNPVPMSTLHKWLPDDALHLASVPLADRFTSAETSRVALESKVETTFSTPLAVNKGDCIVVMYGRSGNGATDNETQVHAVMTP